WFFDWRMPRQTTQRIRVVADQGTNSLLVRANPLDMMTVRRLVEDKIDRNFIDSKAVIRARMIGPLKHPKAQDVERVIRKIYREHLNNNLSFLQSGGARNMFLGWGFNLNVDSSGNPRAVDLSISVDDQTNSLIVSCNEAMFEDIKKLVDQLDAAAKNSTRTVKVISVKGIDPLLVQKAIDAIQGRSRPTSGTGPPPGNQPGKDKNNLSNEQSRGPDFSGPGVMDDPRRSLLYDPQHEPKADRTSGTDGSAQEPDPAAPAVQLAKFEEQQPAPPPAAGDIRGP